MFCRYDLWGKPVKTIRTDADKYNITERNPIRYRSYYYDTETGLYYLNARYYDPNTRRFLNADSLAFMGGGDAVSYNLYAYCGNDPVNQTDPSGCISDAAKIGLVVGTSVLFVAAVSILTCGAGTAPAMIATNAFYGTVAVTAVGGVVGYAATGTLEGTAEGMSIGFGLGSLCGVFYGSIKTAEYFAANPAIVQCSTSTPQISKGAVNHLINDHTLGSLYKQIPYMTRAQIETRLEKCFFNANWTNDEIVSAVNYGYNSAIKQGFINGKYVFTYLGDTVTVVLNNGILKTAFGSYSYTYDELMILFGGK